MKYKKWCILNTLYVQLNLRMNLLLYLKEEKKVSRAYSFSYLIWHSKLLKTLKEILHDRGLSTRRILILIEIHTTTPHLYIKQITNRCWNNKFMAFDPITKDLSLIKIISIPFKNQNSIFIIAKGMDIILCTLYLK